MKGPGLEKQACECHDVVRNTFGRSGYERELAVRDDRIGKTTGPIREAFPSFAGTSLAMSQMSRSRPIFELHSSQSGTTYQFLSVRLSFCTCPPTEYLFLQPMTKHPYACWRLNLSQWASKVAPLYLLWLAPLRFLTLISFSLFARAGIQMKRNGPLLKWSSLFAPRSVR